MKNKLQLIGRHDPVTLFIIVGWLTCVVPIVITGEWTYAATIFFGAFCLWFAFHAGYRGGWEDGTRVQLESDREVVRRVMTPGHPGPHKGDE